MSLGRQSAGLLNAVVDSVRTRLWPIPTIALVVAVTAGVLLPVLDVRIDGDLPGWLDGVIFGGDPGAARTLLDAISSSLITVTSLTFSLTVVTLQLASSQFSPRLLRTFTSDLFVQGTLALFLATFIYALTVLRRVRSGGDGGGSFVPRLAVTIAFLLAVASVLALVLFLAHLTKQIRVETMLQNVHSSASRTMAAALPERADSRSVDTEGFAGVHAVPLTSEVSGFLTWVEREQLLGAAVTAGAQVELDVYPGCFLVAGVPIGRAWPLAGGRLEGSSRDDLSSSVSGCLHTGSERTAAQDVGYGLRQLTDVVNKALSPGINDPTTACHALGHASQLLCELAGRQLGPQTISDDDDQVRVLLHSPSLADLVELAIGQPRRYGAGDAQVLTTVLVLLADLAVHIPSDQPALVRGQLDRVRATIARQDFDAVERSTLESRARLVEQRLIRGADARPR